MTKISTEGEERSTTPRVLEVRNLSVAYPTPSAPIHAVRGVSLQICEGETLSLVGETGSGKSTLALAVLGLLDHPVQSGEILFQGRAIHSLTRGEWKRLRSREIGMVFQDSRSALNPVITILDHMIETIRAHQKLSRRDARDRGIDILREVGIPEAQGNLYPFELSGGTCQRAGIALAVCNKPRLLIADEPTSAIDVAIQAQILDLLQSMKERHGLSLLLVSHDLPLIAQVSDRICVMYCGRIVESGDMGVILGAPAHPYTRNLVRCQPSLNHHHEINRLSPVPGALPGAGQEFTGCAFAPRCSLADPRCRESTPSACTITATHAAACFNATAGGQ